MRSLFLTASLLALATPFTAQAQSAPAPMAATTTADADPALWVVKDADTTIYLFGTIHVLKPGLTWFDEAVKSAFDQSGTLVLEMVTPDQATMQQLVMTRAMNPTGPSLPERLPAADRPMYLKSMADLGLPATALDRADPWFAATTMSLLPLMRAGYDANSGPESVLTAAAKSAGKPVEGLETAEIQIGYLDGLSEPLQIAFLKSTMKELPNATTEVGKMVDNWSKGDPQSLADQMNEGMRETPELGKILLTDRNARWATWIKQRLATPGIVFVAVGAGHLAGTGSVQDQLTGLGLTATRIQY